MPASSITLDALATRPILSSPVNAADVSRQMARQHHIVLMEHGDQRGSSERDRAVPVTGQAQALGVDLDPSPVAGGRANDVDRVVVDRSSDTISSNATPC